MSVVLVLFLWLRLLLCARAEYLGLGWFRRVPVFNLRLVEQFNFIVKTPERLLLLPRQGQ